VRLVDHTGALHLRPFDNPCTRRPGTFDAYAEDRSRVSDIHFFVRGAPYTIAGIFPSDLHLFSTAEPDDLLLFGSDEYGRDVFARFLHGGRISLVVGVLGTALSLIVALALGGTAGFHGKWVDHAIMRATEVFLALPWFYLLLAARMMLPLEIDSRQVHMLLVALIGLIGWAAPARLIRGVALEVRERDHVLAAKASGATNRYVLWRHVLPATRAVVLTQATLLLPQFTLAEVTLSFFGLGVGEPTPSWGGLLASVQRYPIIASYWWMSLPALVLVPIFWLYYSLAESVQKRTQLA
jgi:peptide/nickel transport system permease protein